MTARSTLLQCGLAVVGMLTAFFVWSRPEAPEGTEETVVLEGFREGLQTLHYESFTSWADLYPQADQPDGGLWLRYGTKTGPGGLAYLPDGGLADAGVASANVTPPERVVLANDAATRLLDRVMPLKASRAFGKMTPDKLKELGLSDSPKKLDLTVKGVAHHFTVSTSTVGSAYLEDDKGNVYLISGSVFPELDTAGQRLVDRRIHTFKLNDIDGLTLELGSKSKDFLPTVTSSGLITQVAPKSEAKKPNAEAKSWFEKTWRVFPSEVLGKGENPPSGSPVSQFKIEYRHGDSSVGWLEVAKSGADLYARTEHTAGWNKIRLADDVLAQASNLLATK